MTAHVPLPLAAKVDELASRLDRSRGWVVKQALAAWVEEEERRYRLTCEALAAMERGEGVASEQVEDWLDSLGTAAPLPKPVPSPRG
jgi:predicted transcriptional regulator